MSKMGGCAKWRNLCVLAVLSSVAKASMAESFAELPQVYTARLRGGKGQGDPGILGDIRRSIEQAHEDVAVVQSALDPRPNGSEVVTVDLSAIEAFTRSLDPLRVKKASSMRQALPLMFDDFEQEVNFWALNSLLNFGSGWHQIRSEKIRAKHGPPHRDSILHMLIGFHMENKKLDAQGLTELTSFGVSVALGVSLTKEERIAPDSPIRQDVSSDDRWYVDAVHHMLESVGSELVSRGFRSLGDFVMSTDEQAHVRTKPLPDDSSMATYSAGLLVHRLSTVFDSLFDATSARANITQAHPAAASSSRRVQFHRRACLVAEDLHHRFSKVDARLRFADVQQLTLGADAETYGTLMDLKILVPSEAVGKKIRSRKALKAGSAEEEALRVAAAKACLLIAQELSKQPQHVSAPENVSSAHVASANTLETPSNTLETPYVSSGHVFRHFDMAARIRNDKKIKELDARTEKKQKELDKLNEEKEYRRAEGAPEEPPSRHPEPDAGELGGGARGGGYRFYMQRHSPVLKQHRSASPEATEAVVRGAPDEHDLAFII